MIPEPCNLKRRYKTFLVCFLSWKYLLLLTFLAFSLQVVSVCLSWWVEKVSNRRNTEIEQPNQQGSIIYQISVSVEQILKLITRSSVLDTTGEYKFAVGILRINSSNSNFEKSIEEKDEITLVSQCSLSRLHLLPELSKRWEGGISIAVFLLPEEIEFGISILLLQRKCAPDIYQKVTFSVVYPLSSSHHPTLALSSLLEDVPCDEASFFYSKFNGSNYDFGTVSYPNNLLRNVARKAVKTSYMFVVDIDMIPSQHLHSRFLSYLKANRPRGIFKREQEKTVWVVPSYEVSLGSRIPNNKSDLLQLREIGKARPFYQELCWKCQKYTEYDAWEKQKSRANERENDPLQHLYEVLWKDPWEPFYISKTNVPLYDERFRQYGFNRISQVCELHVAGYRFLVLDSAFVVHRGFKTSGDLHKRKDEELERNRMIFRQFKIDLKEKYPESSRRCY